MKKILVRPEVKPNLIIGMAKSLPYRTLKPFVSTLKKTGYSDDCVIFYGKIDKTNKDGMDSATLKQLEQAGFILTPFRPNFPYLEGDLALEDRWLKKPRLRNLHMFAYRLILNYTFLKKYGGRYGNVFLTGTRDVIFQKNPFDFNIPPDKICVFLEDESKKIRDTNMNTREALETFGEEGLEMIGDYPIANADTICLGPVQLVLDYMEVLINLLAQYGNPKTTDQAVHNYALHTNLFPHVQMFKNDDGPVYNMAYFKTARLNKSGQVLNARGEVPLIVHMYDRYIFVAIRYQPWEIVLRLIWKKGPHQWYTTLRFRLAIFIKKLFHV